MIKRRPRILLVSHASARPVRRSSSRRQSRRSKSNAWRKSDLRDSFTTDRFEFHHGDCEREQNGRIQIIGHFHPAATLHDGAGLRLKFPAFVQESGCWILPAFSPWARRNRVDRARTESDLAVYAEPNFVSRSRGIVRQIEQSCQSGSDLDANLNGRAALFRHRSQIGRSA